MSPVNACPDCGATLSSERWSAGLCLSCLLQLGLDREASPAAAGGRPADVQTMPSLPALAEGQILGGRYRVRALLGRGGMGEVFRAFDLKLRVDVALKAMRPLLLADERALAWLRQEVRAAREVVSPNVCRVFDLVEVDGRELVAMEYVDGVTLGEVLRERSPLQLQEARDIAAQFLAGLDAIHAAGLVHRDVKPENVMLTRAGRVVVMDFGVTRAATESSVRTVAGTAAYMAPEQALGGAVDARADLYSAGVVLAELVAPGGARTAAAREALWLRIREQPPRPGDTPWAAVLRKAVAHNRDDRYVNAAALSRALDEVTLRTSGDESARPYPGLAAFAESDAGFFVGRELEIETLWRKLRRPHLHALIGPSGAGKSSFLRAGLGPSAPPGWRVLFATPGTRPFAALAHVLAPELAADAEAVARLIDFEQSGVAVEVITRWRRRHEHALLVIDQFEELFTQSADEVQARFSELLARLALDADVHVLLSMRDDFLFRCQRFESLAPVFSELTAIGPPAGAALRRALVQPALKCGYRFEDEAIVDEMLAAVAGERGALPLAAFAMARLWDTRDRERGLLTRDAYDAIGGVAGALAQHAEATLDAIGQDRLPIVRELFRNLVTAQGTRATLERGELLSVFEARHREEAAAVLDALVDARLLTAYDTEARDGEAAGRRVEIVHESLLTAWPRLVRWQIQDQDGAQLRDQLRQASRLWEARGKPEDLLWTGTSFREYELWRERYAGTLSETESTFAKAMTARAARRRVQRGAAMAAVVTASLLVAIGMSVLRQQSETARAEADAAARNAEAQQLFALGQLELGRQPGIAVAYALASLERNDHPEVRRFALRALARGPVPMIVARTETGGGAAQLSFSRAGEWLGSLNTNTGAVRLWRADGSARQIPESGSPGNYAHGQFADDERSFVVTTSDSIGMYSLPDVGAVRRVAGSFRWGFVRGASIVTGDLVPPLPDGRQRRLIKTYPLPAGAPETTVGVWAAPPGAAGSFAVDRTGEWTLGIYDGSLFENSLRQIDRPARLIVRGGDDPVSSFWLSPDESQIHVLRRSTAHIIVSRETGEVLATPVGVGQSLAAGVGAAISPDGRQMAVALANDRVQVLDLAAPRGVEPVVAQLPGRPLSVAVDPNGWWLAVQDRSLVTLWPLRWSHARGLRHGTTRVSALAIDPLGRWMATGGPETPPTLWSLREGTPTERRLLGSQTFAGGNAAPGSPSLARLAASPRGDVLAAGTLSGFWLVPLHGRPERLPGFNGIVRSFAFDRTGQWLAAGGGIGSSALSAPGENVVRVWNVDTREVRVLAGDGQSITGVAFLPDGRLLTAGRAGIREWNLATGTSTLLMSDDLIADLYPSPDGRRLLLFRAGLRPGGGVGTVAIYDVTTGTTTPLTSHGSLVTSVAWHPSGDQVVTGSQDGTVRIGPADGGEPHLLFGHEDFVWEVAIDPLGRFAVSASADGTARQWPMPAGQPMHTRPRAELLDRLRSLTSYRIVHDASTTSGYRVDFEPFTGWKREPPQW